MLLFWRKGFHATSISDLCEAIGVSTPSLYAAFSNKESLYTEAVELYMKITEKLLWGYLKEGPTARDGMRGLLIAAVKELTSTKSHPSGCFVTLATIDEDMPPSISKAILKSRNAWLETIRAHVRMAVKKGELPATTDVNVMSRFFQAIVQSIGIQSHDGVTVADLEGMVETAMAIWPTKLKKQRTARA
jgi:AcrR family transcriptional regulator